MVFGKGKPHWNRKGKGPLGGHRDNAGRKKEMGEDGAKVEEGKVAVGLEKLTKKAKNTYFAQKREESKARLLEAPAKKTKEELVREQEAGRCGRLANRRRIKTQAEGTAEAEAEHGAEEAKDTADEEFNEETVLEVLEEEVVGVEPEESEEEVGVGPATTEEEIDVTLAEATGQEEPVGPRVSERLLVEAAQFYDLYEKKAGKSFEQEVKKSMRNTYTRNKDGGKGFKLALDHSFKITAMIRFDANC